MPKAKFLQLPNLVRNSAQGTVRTMEWTSDGYALAVGWDNGWAIWSIGGRCLAWGFGVDDEVATNK